MNKKPAMKKHIPFSSPLHIDRPNKDYYMNVHRLDPNKIQK